MLTSHRPTSIWLPLGWLRRRITTSCAGSHSTADSKPTIPLSKKAPSTAHYCPTVRGRMRFGATDAGRVPQRGCWSNSTVPNSKRWAGKSFGRMHIKRNKSNSAMKDSESEATAFQTVNSSSIRLSTPKTSAWKSKMRGLDVLPNGPIWTSKVTFAPTTEPPSPCSWAKESMLKSTENCNPVRDSSSSWVLSSWPFSTSACAAGRTWRLSCLHWVLRCCGCRGSSVILPISQAGSV